MRKEGVVLRIHFKRERRKKPCFVASKKTKVKSLLKGAGKSKREIILVCLSKTTGLRKGGNDNAISPPSSVWQSANAGKSGEVKLAFGNLAENFGTQGGGVKGGDKIG